MSVAERSIRQSNARSLVETRYSWNIVGRKMIQVYEWVLGGSKPEFIEAIH